MSVKLWEITEVTPGFMKLQDPEGWWKARVKFDGCIDFNIYCNVPFTALGKDKEAEVDYIHICDLNEFIARLRELHELTKDFREE